MSGSADEAGGPRRLSALSPLARVLGRAPAVALPLGIAVLARTGLQPRAAAALVVIAAALLAVALGLGYVGWARTTYWFDADGDLRVDSGVLTRRERRVQLSRLQAVDVVRPLVARVLGLSELRIEVAGEGESRVSLAFVEAPAAQALRQRLLARHVVPTGSDGQGAPTPDDEDVIGVVPGGRLAGSLLLRTESVALLMATAVFLTATAITGGAGALLLAVISGGLPAIIVVSAFVRYFGFTISTAPDGVRLRHGLTQTQAQTVPRGRVQSVEFETPWLWGRLGWTRVNVNIAGVGITRDDSGSQIIQSVLVPVAPAAQARRIVQRVLPGVDAAAVPLVPAPRAARRRSPLQWRRLGAGHDARVFVTRRGWLTERLAVIPHERLQSARVTQGPWERALGLASVCVDTTVGPVRVEALRRGAQEARSLADSQVARSRAARGAGER